MEFPKLNPAIHQALKKLGIEEFTEPQKRAIPPIMKGKNVLLVAPTGIGKTEAAILPIFEKIMELKPNKISVLYITPLRALNRDMLRRMAFFGEELSIDVAVRHGDTSQSERARQSRHPPDVMITTPETLQIMLTGRKLMKHLRNVRWVVVDEIHELAGDERGSQLSVGLERLTHLCKKDFQRIGLSATVGSPEEVGSFLAGVGREVEIVKVPVPKGMRIFVEYPEKTEEDEELAKIIRMREEQASALRRSKELVEKHRSTLFFVNTRDTAEFLSSRVRILSEEPKIGVHHGSLSKEVRIQMEDDFKLERIKGLVCTSSLELGIDVGSADFVLQFNSPREVTRLIQRIGRSGHGVGEVSDGVIIATNEDDFAEACVIARRALREELEPLKVRKNNFSVLANQIVSFAMTYGICDVKETFNIIRRAYPFGNLKEEDYLRVLNQLKDLKTVWLRENTFGKSRGSLPYFYENISMIPDVKTYRVFDLSSRKSIGTLDEWFVAEYAKLGAIFVMKGTAWRFVEFKEGELIVEPVKEIGDIPSWIGEEIPVPFEVASEVGRLRRERNFDQYPCNGGGKRKFQEYIQRQENFPLPTDKVVTVEADKDFIVVNSCFGSKVNETLGQLISSLLSARFGESVGIQTDPYRVILELPRAVDPQKIIDILSPEDPQALESLMRVVLKNSSYLRWQFVHVAKKFGAIRKDVDWEAVNIPKLIQAFENTPLYEEAINKVLWERMDVETTARVLSKIKRGEIAILKSKLSPIGKAGIEQSRQVMAPRGVDRATLMAIKKRLEEEEALLLCLNCKKSRKSMLSNIKEKLKCPICEGVMVAALRPYERSKADLVAKRKLTDEERREVKKIYTNASLVMAHGRKAVMALMARGVGPETAARILRNYHEREEDFLRDLLAAEINYARTKRFWD